MSSTTSQLCWQWSVVCINQLNGYEWAKNDVNHYEQSLVYSGGVMCVTLSVISAGMCSLLTVVFFSPWLHAVLAVWVIIFLLIYWLVCCLSQVSTLWNVANSNHHKQRYLSISAVHFSPVFTLQGIQFWLSFAAIFYFTYTEAFGTMSTGSFHVTSHSFNVVCRLCVHSCRPIVAVSWMRLLFW